MSRASVRVETIGWFTASCLLVSNIIGGGIFTTTGLMARELGDPMLILLLWTVGGLFAVGGAMVYGELGARLPHAGGDYVYLREAYGPLVAFLSGWTSFTIGFGAAVAASAISFSAYAFRIFPMMDESGWRAKGLSLALLWLVTLVHCRGLAGGGRLQRIITSTKVVAIGVLIVGGLLASAAQWDWLSIRDPATAPNAGSIAVAFVIVIYCYLGWNVAGFIATEITDPRRTLPRVMIGGTAFVATIYVLLNFVYLSALSVAGLAQEPIVPVAEKSATALWGPSSGHLVAALLCLSIAGAVSAMTWAGPRVYWAMAQDGVLSSWLAHRHPESGVPARAIMLQTLWASVLILSGTFEQLIVYSGLVLASFMCLTLSTIFPLRSRRDQPTDVYRVPAYPILPALLIISSLLVVCSSLLQRPLEALYGMLTVMAGIPFYLLWKKKRQDDLPETAQNK
ncbi:MAG TPA: amino acid permease [Nitrospiraceae bacterium]|nr:amino acid permease [Nitrospiraceae bacterium]